MFTVVVTSSSYKKYPAVIITCFQMLASLVCSYYVKILLYIVIKTGRNKHAVLLMHMVMTLTVMSECIRFAFRTMTHRHAGSQAVTVGGHVQTDHLPGHRDQEREVGKILNRNTEEKLWLSGHPSLPSQIFLRHSKSYNHCLSAMFLQM